ncbi:FYVE, RhoGEF and PH domain-containing protein 6-like [Osmerus mordax]|uniref:FYVE, RhoGEF and PH domain-containing protein 6-like n=1 Tax=Osmerus mordax TaxID=8014 RepID=UPI00350F3981
MSSGTDKPPLAPKPKIPAVQPQRLGLSPSSPKRDGLSLASPATPRRVKPALAPKPDLPKITTTVKSIPLSSKTVHQTMMQEKSEISRSIGFLNSQNGIQQENKKPDWDYIIPICLCSQENCQCLRKSHIAEKTINKIEKNLKTLQKGHSEESVPRYQAKKDNSGETKESPHTSRLPDVCIPSQSTSSHTKQPKLPEETPIHNQLKTLNQNLNSVVDTLHPVVKPSLPHRTQGAKTDGNVMNPSGSTRSDAEEELTSSTGMPGTSLSSPTSVPAVPMKPLPVPRKPRKAALDRQERVEEGSEEREGTVSEVMVSVERKTNQCSPPAPPARKKPYLSGPLRAQGFSPHHEPLPQDMEEEELVWSDCVHEMEISVDEEDDEKGSNENQGVYCNLTCPPRVTSQLKQLELSGHLPLTVATGIISEEDGVFKMTAKMSQRNSSPAWMLGKELSVEAAEEKTAEGEGRPSLSKPTQDGGLNNKAMRVLPPSPKKKPGRVFNQTPALHKGKTNSTPTKPSRSSQGKQRPKSFSSADITRSEGQKLGSFRRLLDLKLSVKMLPNLLVKGGKTLEGSTKETEQCVDGLPRGLQDNLGVRVWGGRKLSCPLIGLEQSVDGDEFCPGVEQAVEYENVPLYEEIPEYINPAVASAVSSPVAFPAGKNYMYDDENIYEEQEPYVPLDKYNQQQQPHGETKSACIDEESTQLDDGHSDEDMVHSSDEEEDGDDDSSISSKGDLEQPGESEVYNVPKKSKIVHIAHEIMSSEHVFVDALKLLHIDFRHAVVEASRQTGKPVIEERVLNQILYYLPQLYELNQDLLRELKERVAKWDEHGQLADIFVKKGPYLKMYSTYIREFDKNVALLDEQSKKNSAFAGLVREFEASPRCANLALRHYLLKPVQRIPQYQLLLTDYLKNLPPDSADYKDTQAALGIVKEVANHANDIMKQGDNFQKLIQLQCSLNGHHEIVQPGRVFLKEGILMKLSRKVMQPRMFFLFNDALLYTTSGQSGQYKLNNMLSLAGMKVSKPSQEAYQNELNIESVERSFILSASSATERDGWLEAISTAINDYTRKKITFISSKSLEEVETQDIVSGSPLGSTAPIWIPDLRATMCMICTCEFTLTWRRHHCRACGKVVCQACSTNKHCLEYRKNQLARVCDQCIFVLQEQRRDQTMLLSPVGKSSFTFSRKQKKIPAALKEVTANTDNSSMSGYLQRSKGNKKQGKRLWFVIKNKVLYTYAASEDVAALESQPLLGFILKEEFIHKLQFKLYHKNTLYYIFKADDLQTTQRWKDAFKEASVL